MVGWMGNSKADNGGVGGCGHPGVPPEPTVRSFVAVDTADRGTARNGPPGVHGNNATAGGIACSSRPGVPPDGRHTDVGEAGNAASPLATAMASHANNARVVSRRERSICQSIQPAGASTHPS